MATFDALADLPLEVDGYELEGLEFKTGEFERLTTVIHLQGARRGGPRRGRRLRTARTHRPPRRRSQPRPHRPRHPRRVLRVHGRRRHLPAGARARGLAPLPPLRVRGGRARPRPAPGRDRHRRGARPRAAAGQVRLLDAALAGRRAALDDRDPAAQARPLPDPALQARPDQRLGRRADRRAGRDRRRRLARPQGLLQRHTGRRRDRSRALREADRGLPRGLARGPRRHR